MSKHRTQHHGPLPLLLVLTANGSLVAAVAAEALHHSMWHVP